MLIAAVLIRCFFATVIVKHIHKQIHTKYVLSLIVRLTDISPINTNESRAKSTQAFDEG